MPVKAFIKADNKATKMTNITRTIKPPKLLKKYSKNEVCTGIKLKRAWKPLDKRLNKISNGTNTIEKAINETNPTVAPNIEPSLKSKMPIMLFLFM